MEITGIKKACGDFNNHESNNYFNCKSAIMFDLEDGKVWTDCFIDCNSWKEYESNTIIDITEDCWIVNEFDEPIFPLQASMKNIKKVCEWALTNKKSLI